MKIESRIGQSGQSDETIYTFITDFNNFRSLLPEGEVTDWESSENECSFRVDPVGRIGLRIVEKTPFSMVKMESVEGISAYQFSIWIQLKRIAENDTRVKITIEPRVNRILIPMIKGPLKQFVDGLVDRVEAFRFTS